MSWYARSLAPEDVHRGVLTRGHVRAVCGLDFIPPRASDQGRCSTLPERERVCPVCMAPPPGQLLAIPATCSQHPRALVIDLVARRLSNGRIELEPSGGHGECQLTVDLPLLFDALGQWLA